MRWSGWKAENSTATNWYSALLANARIRHLANTGARWVKSLSMGEMVLADAWAESHRSAEVQQARDELRVALGEQLFDHTDRADHKFGVYTRLSNSMGAAAMSRIDERSMLVNLRQVMRDAVRARMAVGKCKQLSLVLAAPYNELMALIAGCREDAAFAELAWALASEFSGSVAELRTVDAVVSAAGNE